MQVDRPIEVLVVEDNPADARLTREALDESEGEHRVHLVEDGQDALDFLHQRGEHEAAPRPDLVLLDLNLPRLPGRDVLERVKTDEDLAEIPVVVLSTSDHPDDIRRCYELHASAYVTKPVGLEPFVERVGKIGEYWTRVAHTPDHRAGTGRA